MKKRLIRIVVISAILFAAAAAYIILQERSADPDNLWQISPASGNAASIVAKDFGGDFTLTNQEGQRVTQADFDGRWRLIYFGFTFCPAICPTELQRMASVLDKLPKDMAAAITPIFVTVDPERDTVEVMKNYVEMFHPRLVGLTGTPKEIKQVKDGYKIYAAKVQDETMSDYTMDHSSYIYFMDPQNNLRRIFKMTDTLDKILSDVAMIMQHAQKSSVTNNDS
jgi:protein SCO1/2